MMDRNFIIRDSRFIILTRRAIRDCECRVVSVVLVMSQPTRYAAAAVAGAHRLMDYLERFARRVIDN